LNHHLEQLQSHLSLGALFPEKPLIRFVPDLSHCPRCHRATQVRKTHTRKIATLCIGDFIAHETQGYCPHCVDRPVFRAAELHQLVPRGARYGYDVMVYVGQALFLRCRNGKEIRRELSEKNIRISQRAVGYLGQRFIVYLALVHEQSQAKLKQFMDTRGGYILHLDGTCEGDSPHLMSSIDALSKIVLNNIKIPTENAGQLIPFLRQIKQSYGNPIALVHDMGVAILSAVKEVFPGLPDYICHFHFLKDIGKDLFGDDYSTIRRHLKTHCIRSDLRKIVKGLKKAIDGNPDSLQCLHRYLESKTLLEPQTPLMPLVKAYLMICWILEARNESHGFGFPFDRPHLDFYLRLQEAYPDLKELKQQMAADASLLLLAPLSKTLADKALASTVLRMQEKIRIFDQLREAMRIAQPDSQSGLNDEGDADIETIRSRVIAFRLSNEIEELSATAIAYKKMCQQIDKYWDKLFADPILVVTKTGTVTLQPQRTNNILEQFFRYLKRLDRKRSGNHSLTKTLTTMFAQTPLVKNLQNPQYMEIILNGKATLAERFAEVDVDQVRKLFAEEQKVARKYPKRMGEVFKISHLPTRLGMIQPKQASCS
jgi:hypothetical protein